MFNNGEESITENVRERERERERKGKREFLEMSKIDYPSSKSNT